MSGAVARTPSTDIAIVGMSGRFPGAPNLEQFWTQLCEGREAISFFSDAELENPNGSRQERAGAKYVAAAAVLGEIDKFDASFFGFSPREAQITDPQHRLFLECAWEALEDAAYDVESSNDLIGVYGGCGISTYLFNNIAGNESVVNSVDAFQIMVGNDKDHLTTQVSYKLNLRGPSMTIQTTCSTSLVAVCVACQSLLNHECDAALAGGVGIRVPEKVGYLYQEGGIMSPDGHCRPFDAAAQGTVRGNGLGVIVLKRLEDALDSDSIYAIIKGCAVNNDGRLKVGYTAPSIDGQAAVIAMAHAVSGVPAESITYIETHGTGTALGDPIEIAALSQAFRGKTSHKHFCALGSVKSNIGHLDSAAGIAGLIKTVLALKHRKIPPTLHFTSPNPQIDFASGPFFVNDRLSEWNSGSTLRRAGVSSFGIGGTNAHVVLEEAPQQPDSSIPSPSHLVVLSARSKTALDSATSRLAASLERQPQLDLGDVAYTCQAGRRRFEYRRAAVCRDLEDAILVLSGRDTARIMEWLRETRPQRIAFLFPGQGSQCPNMGADLYRFEPVFAREIDRCSDLLHQILGFDLASVLYPSPRQPEESAQRLLQTAVSQPALFTFEYALATLWMTWGVRPDAMLGHSIGEYVAACISGVMTLEDALALVAYRGQLMQRMTPGLMLSVLLAPEEVQKLLMGTEVSLAAANGPSSSVVSGPKPAVEALAAQLTSNGVGCSMLATSHAFHSSMMDPVIEPFMEKFGTIAINAPKIPYVSNVTGTWIEAERVHQANYWTEHLRGTVQFAAGLRVFHDSDWMFIEVGQGHQLSALVRQNFRETPNRIVVSSLPDPPVGVSDLTLLQSALGKVWLAGIPVDWQAVNSGRGRRRVHLPSYPFERKSYWIEPSKTVPTKSIEGPHRLDLPDWLVAPAWKEVPLLTYEVDAVTTPCLIFLDDSDLGKALLSRLREHLHSVSSVTAGSEYRKQDDATFTIRPGEVGDFVRLLAHLQQSRRFPTSILFLWNAASGIKPAEALDETESDDQYSFYSLLFLGQALGSEAAGFPVSIAVLSYEMQSVTGLEDVIPEKALVLGPCAVIPQEYLNVKCKSIDVSGNLSRESVDSLIAELNTIQAETSIAYRDKRRFVRTYESVRSQSHSGSRLRTHGVYLITGGLGGIGLNLARCIAECSGGAKLVLTGRSAFPERTAWEHWRSAHGEQDKVSRVIREVEAIERLGSEIVIVQADVTSQKQMHETVEMILRRFGGLHGVIHSAGIAGGGLIQFKTRKLAETVLAPKVTGTLVLDSILTNVELDFFVLCSSLSSVVGGLGQVDYCAANAFLDSFAHRRHLRNQVGLAVNWPTWRETGMAVSTPLPAGMEPFRREALRLGISSREGAQIFLSALESDMPQLLVSPYGLPSNDVSRTEGPASFGTSAAIVPVAGDSPRPSVASSYVAPRNRVEETIVEIWRQVLGIKGVGVYDNFFELGGHSLLAIQVVSRIREAFATDVPARMVFDAQTVSDLAVAVSSRTEEQLASITDKVTLVEQMSSDDVRKILERQPSDAMDAKT